MLLSVDGIQCVDLRCCVDATLPDSVCVDLRDLQRAIVFVVFRQLIVAAS
jgi:hypothetical protein